MYSHFKVDFRLHNHSYSTLIFCHDKQKNLNCLSTKTNNKAHCAADKDWFEKTKKMPSLCVQTLNQ